MTGLDPEKCAQRNRLSALRYGLNTAPIQLARTMPGYGQPGGPDYVRGKLWTSDEQALQMINALLPENAPPLTADQVYIFPMESANNQFISDRYMFLGTSTLKNIALDAQAGFAFMNSHRTGDLSTPSELPFGKTFTGRYERYPSETGGAPFERVVLGVYMLRGVQPNGANGPSTDAMYAAIQAGTLFDVSMGINGGNPICDVCGYNVRSEECGHVPGTSRNVTKDQAETQTARGVKNGYASYTLEDGHGGEVSGVYDGAVPGAGFAKGMEKARHNELTRVELREMCSAYSTLLAKGDLGMDAEQVIEQASDSIVAKLLRKLGSAGEQPRNIPLTVAEVQAAQAATAPLQPIQGQPVRDNSSQQNTELERLRQENIELKSEKRLSSAQSFVEDLVTEKHRLMPSGQADAVALINQLAIIDELSPVSLTVQHPDGAQVQYTSLAELTKSVLLNAPAHDLHKDHGMGELPAGTKLVQASVPTPDPEAEGKAQGQKFVEENYPDKPEKKK